NAYPLTSPGAVTQSVHSHAFLSDVGYNTPELLDEFDTQGLHVLVPFFNLGPNMVFCSEQRTSLRDFDGTLIAGSSAAIAGQLEALGGTFTSLTWSEYYEGISRNVIDCFNSSLVSAYTQGLAEPAPYVT